jgi:hypothetical protein
VLRTAASRTVEPLWRKIGRVLNAFTPAECAHYLCPCRFHLTRKRSSSDRLSTIDYPTRQERVRDMIRQVGAELRVTIVKGVLSQDHAHIVRRSAATACGQRAHAAGQRPLLAVSKISTLTRYRFEDIKSARGPLLAPAAGGNSETRV